MDEAKKPRRRAIRLTERGQEVIGRALSEKWSKNERAGKLTREVRSEFLGISIVTAERLLSRQGVDRSTVAIALRNLGLQWDDDFVERLSADLPTTPSEEPSVQPPLPDGTRGSRPPRFRRAALAGLVLTVVVIVSAYGVSTFKVSSRHAPPREGPSDAWREGFLLLLADGSRAYHQGRYDEADSKLTRAIFAARSHAQTVDLAGSLRMKADLEAAHGEVDKAKEDYEEALTLRRVMQQEISYPPIFEALGDLETRIGDYGNARTNLEASLAGFKRFHDPVGVAMATRDLGSLAFDQGYMDSADAWLRVSLDACRSLGKTDLETDIRARQALVLRERGELEEARKRLKTCLAYWTERKHPRWIAVTEFQLGTVEAKARNFDGASTLFSRSQAGFQRVGDSVGNAELKQWQAKLSAWKAHRAGRLI